jgi:hypothetical protein
MMKLDQKRAIAFMIFLMACFGIGTITSGAVSIASYNHEVFFDENFSFLNHYAVNDFIPVAAVVMSAIGWLCSLWAMQFLQPKTVSSIGAFFRRILIGLLPVYLVITALFLLGRHIENIYIHTPYSGLWVFATNLLFFFEGGLVLGISFVLYGRMQQEQKSVSE